MGREKTIGTSASVAVTCRGGPGATCKVTGTLMVIETTKGGETTAIAATTKSKKKVVVLGTNTLTLEAGQAQIVAVRLNASGKRLLSHWHTIKVKLAITDSSTTVSTKTITFKARSKRRKH